MIITTTHQQVELAGIERRRSEPPPNGVINKVTNNDEKETKYDYIYIVTTILLVILFFGLVKMEQKRRNEVKLKGVETVGIVIHKSISRDNQGGAMNFNIKFEFAHNGKRFVVSTTPIFNSRSDYDNAIIGMQYKVKYLPNAPRKAIIFLDQPIE